MTGVLEEFIREVEKKLQHLGYSSPTGDILSKLVNTAYLATLRTEESRLVRGSLIFADPTNADPDTPPLRRADYPMFAPFDHPALLTVEKLVKLSRAVDGWAGSIAVHGTSPSSIVAWGILDQLVQQNVRLHRESDSGASPPGILRLVMDGVGALSAYHSDLFLAGIRQDQIVLSERRILYSNNLRQCLHPFLKPIAQQISMALGDSAVATYERRLFEQWSTVIARICIGIRRAGTGGALLISHKPIPRFLDIFQRFPYFRMGHAMILNVLDSEYEHICKQAYINQYDQEDSVSRSTVREEHLATADAEDRKEELAGAIRIVTSLACMDGLVLFSPLLEVIGFGVKIRSTPPANHVYVGQDFVRRGVREKCVDLSRFGTRHMSMLSYCQVDRKAIGIVISQDGHVRLMMSNSRNLVLYENLQLLSYENDIRGYVSMRQKYRSNKVHLPKSLGFTDMPKTLEQLMSLKRKKTDHF
jgi:hypothetical protein